MDYKYKQLEQELSALSKVFSELGARLAEVAKEVTSPGVMPSEKLLEQISVSRTTFEIARAAVHAHAEAMLVSPLPKVGEVASIAAIETLLKASAAAEENKGSVESRREEALTILNRALSIAHKEIPEFKPLQDCQATLAELRSAIAGVLWPHHHPESESIVAARHPANALLSFVENLNTLEDEKWMALEATITESYGKPLFVAASRGKLAVQPAKTESRPASAKPAATAPAPAPVKVSTATPELPKPAAVVEKSAEKPVEKKAVAEKAPEKPAPAPAPVPVASAPAAAPPATVEKKISTPPAPVAGSEKKEPIVAKPVTPAVAPAEKPAPVPAAVVAPPVVIPSVGPAAVPAASAPAPAAPAPPSAPVNGTPAPPVAAPAAPVNAAQQTLPQQGMPQAATPLATSSSIAALATATELTSDKKPAMAPAVEVADKQRKEPRLAATPAATAARIETRPVDPVSEEAEKAAAGDASQRPQRWGFWRGNR